MKKTKIFSILLAVAMIFSAFSLSVLAASGHEGHSFMNGFRCDAYASFSDTSASADSEISCSLSGTIQCESNCHALTDGGDWLDDYATSSETTGYTSCYASVSGSGIVAVYSDHNFYYNGGYVDSIGVDVTLGEDR